MGRTSHTDSNAALVEQAADLRRIAEFLVSGQDSEDVVQDAMVTALSQAQAPRSLGPWLRTVVRNRARARAREEGRRRTRERRAAQLGASGAPALDEDTYRKQLITAMGHALDELEAPYREVLRARFFDGLTPTQIAAQSDCAPATIRWRVHEGLQRLRLKMDDHFEGRAQWLGALALALGVSGKAQAAHGSSTSQMEHSTMSRTLSWKIVAAGLGLAAVVIVAGATLLDEVVEPAPVEMFGSEDDAKLSAVVDTDTTPAASTLAWLGEPAEPRFDGELERGCSGEGCVWGTPELAHCPMLLDATTLEEPLQVAVDWEPNDEGGHDPKVEVTSGCYEEDLCGGVQRRLCGEGEEPARHQQIAACVLAEVVARGQADLARGEGWGQRYWIDPAPEGCEGDGCEQHQSVLPAASEGAADLGPEQAIRELQLPGMGAEDGALTMMECGAYSCFYTDKVRGEVDELLARYPQLEFRWLHFPIELDRRAGLMAMAAVAAHNQDKFWQLHDALFDKADVRDEADLSELARAAGLDVARFEADLADPATAQRVADQRAFCEGNGVRGTPSFLIDGELITGARTLDELAQVIEEAL